MNKLARTAVIHREDCHCPLCVPAIDEPPGAAGDALTPREIGMRIALGLGLGGVTSVVLHWTGLGWILLAAIRDLLQ